MLRIWQLTESPAIVDLFDCYVVPKMFDPAYSSNATSFELLPIIHRPFCSLIMVCASARSALITPSKKQKKKIPNASRLVWYIYHSTH